MTRARLKWWVAQADLIHVPDGLSKNTTTLLQVVPLRRRKGKKGKQTRFENSMYLGNRENKELNG